MSKKRKRKRSTPYGHDKHHILFYRSEWNKGYALLLRRAFVYDIPVAVHQELHSTVGKVPVLDNDEAKALWEQYKLLDHELDLFEALRWLQLNAPTSEFAIAIMAQRGFLTNKMGG